MKCSDCGGEVNPVVATDCDGTLADYYNGVSDFAAVYFDRVMPPIEGWDGSGEMEEHMGLTKVEYREMKLAFRQGGSKRSLRPYVYARNFMVMLHRAGIETWVATSRPWQRLDNIDPDTREWLRRYGMKYHGLIYGDDKYQQLCVCVGEERVLMVVDDLPEQIERASNLGLRTWQVHRSHNRHSRIGEGGDLPDALMAIYEAKEDWDDAHRSR